jgi:hypothetical protein
MQALGNQQQIWHSSATSNRFVQGLTGQYRSLGGKVIYYHNGTPSRKYDNILNKPTMSSSWTLERSRIHGRGVFLSNAVPRNAGLGTGIKLRYGIWPEITPGFGSMINHSYEPTAELRLQPLRRRYVLVARADLPARCEITVDYDRAPWFVANAKPTYV